MLLPNTSSKLALIPAEKIRSFIANSAFNHNGKSINLTISCGISEFTEGDNTDSVFERADKALYLCKKEGRNRCSIINE
jgi:diguanylate cyclase